MRSRNFKLVIKIMLLIICIGGILIGSKYLIEVNNYKKSIASITLSEIDFSNIPDGIYEGDCDVKFIYAKVSVTVKNGAITDLKLIEHRNGRGTPAEKIINEIIDKQTIKVDAVTGATNSSIVIKKAVENALNGEHL